MNVILTVVDSLRADHVGAYGYDRDTTPNLDEFADTATLFKECHSTSTWTRPASTSLLSGLYPPTHGTEHRTDTPPQNLPLLAEWYQQNGFTTACFSAIGHISSATGFDRGFDKIFEVYKHPEVVNKRTTSTATDEVVEEEEAEILAYPRMEDINKLLFDWLNQSDDEDRFILIWAIDPHDPYDPPEDFEVYLDSEYEGPPDFGRVRESFSSLDKDSDFGRLRNLYDCEIRYWDQHFGDIINWLKTNDEYDDSVIGVIGDHGESFGEQVWGGPLTTHGNPPFREQTYVPFVLKTPDEKSGINNEVVSLVDIAPTLLSVSNIEFDSTQFQGSTVYPEPPERDAIFMKTHVKPTSLIYYGIVFKGNRCILIKKPMPDILSWNFVEYRNFATSMFLYFTNKRSLVMGEKDTTQSVEISQFEKLLTDWINESEAYNFGEVGQLTECETIEQLEALGYK